MAHRLPAPSTLEDRRKLLIKTVSSHLPSTKGKDWKKSSLYWLSGLTCRGWTFRSKFGYHKRNVSMVASRNSRFQAAISKGKMTAGTATLVLGFT